MLKKVMLFISALVLATSAFANPVVEQTIYAGSAKENADGLKAQLRTLRVEENGEVLPVVEDDLVYLARLGTSLHGWAITKGYLAEEAVKDHRLFQQALVERYGEKKGIEELVSLAADKKFLIPAKVAPATASKSAAVPAASAPIAPAPVAAAQAPAPAVKLAPVAEASGELATKDFTLEQLRKQRDEIEAQLKENRQVAYRVAKAATDEQAKQFTTKPAMEKFVLEAVKPFVKSPEEQKQVVEAVLVAKEIEGKIATLASADAGHTKSIELLGQHQLKHGYAIGVVGFLALLGLAATWWRIKNVQSKVAVDIGLAKTKAIEAAEQSTEQQLEALRKVVAKKAGREELDELKERVGALDDYLGVDSAWAMSLDEKAELQDRLFGLKVDELVLYAIPRSGEVERQLRFIKINEDQVFVEGIDKHAVTDPVNITNVARIITKAIHAKRLPGIDLKKVAVVHQLEAA